MNPGLPALQATTLTTCHGSSGHALGDKNCFPDISSNLKNIRIKIKKKIKTCKCFFSCSVRNIKIRNQKNVFSCFFFFKSRNSRSFSSASVLLSGFDHKISLNEVLVQFCSRQLTSGRLRDPQPP